MSDGIPFGPLAVDSDYGNSDSHAGIGVPAAWPRQQPCHTDKSATLKLPTKRCGTVGIFARQGGEEVNVYLFLIPAVRDVTEHSDCSLKLFAFV